MRSAVFLILHLGKHLTQIIYMRLLAQYRVHSKPSRCWVTMFASRPDKAGTSEFCLWWWKQLLFLTKNTQLLEQYFFSLVEAGVPIAFQYLFGFFLYWLYRLYTSLYTGILQSLVRRIYTGLHIDTWGRHLLTFTV